MSGHDQYPSFNNFSTHTYELYHCKLSSIASQLICEVPSNLMRNQLSLEHG